MKPSEKLKSYFVDNWGCSVYLAEDVDPEIERLKELNETLKDQLDGMMVNKGVFMALQEEVTAREKRISALEAEIERLKAEYDKQILAKNNRIAALEEEKCDECSTHRIAELEEENAKLRKDLAFLGASYAENGGLRLDMNKYHAAYGSEAGEP